MEDDIHDDRQDGQDRQDDIALLELASMIDEDQPIDWDSEEGVARGDDERAVLAELRVLAALTRVYRDPDAVGLEAPLQTEAQELVEHALPPATWGSLEVFEQVGRGGFAKVYRARDPLGRDVAVKLFPVTPENATALSGRVLREGSLLAKINHRNVVVVHGVERSSGFVGMWMEFIHGRTMEDELRARGPLSAEEATPIGVDLCQALAAVHGRGLVHRDIKAQNVMREAGGRTVLMDFGAGTELSTGLQRPYDTAGTPVYLAPELFDGRPATRASDVYSLGVLLYRMVTDGFPVDGEDRSQIERAHREGRVKRLRDVRPDLPSGFIQTVERALSPDPSARPQTAGELEAALIGKRPPVEPLWSWWQRAAAVAAAIVLVAVPVAWFVANADQRTGQHQSIVGSGRGARTRHGGSRSQSDHTPSRRDCIARATTSKFRSTAEHQARPRRPSYRCGSKRRLMSTSMSSMRDDAASPTGCSRCQTTSRTIHSAPSKVHRLPARLDTNWAVTAKAAASTS